MRSNELNQKRCVRKCLQNTENENDDNELQRNRNTTVGGTNLAHVRSTKLHTQTTERFQKYRIEIAGRPNKNWERASSLAHQHRLRILESVYWPQINLEKSGLQYYNYYCVIQKYEEGKHTSPLTRCSETCDFSVCACVCTIVSAAQPTNIEIGSSRVCLRLFASVVLHFSQPI